LFYSWLRERFGLERVFWDREDIPPGARWVDVVNERLRQSTALPMPGTTCSPSSIRKRRQGRIDMDLMRQAVEQVRATGLGRRGLSADRVEDLQRRVLYGQEWRVTIQSASCVVDE
jgi:hypothetical protein